MFQVPKGMLQTNVYSISQKFKILSFKSPRECYKPNFCKVIWSLLFCFKSPRECYKPGVNVSMFLRGKVFQVPKGMLQTNWYQLKKLHRKSFKSPRECYKRTLRLAPVYFSSSSFQVPKGMLQTEKRLYLSCLYEEVSSPQGNATNPIEFYLVRLLGASFKSPRECYKPQPFPYNLVQNISSFKSPRECYKRKLVSWSHQTSLCFKSPRECYKPGASSFTMPATVTFQVPKGMLQTLLGRGGSQFLQKFQVPKGMLQTVQKWKK